MIALSHFDRGELVEKFIGSETNGIIKKVSPFHIQADQVEGHDLGYRGHSFNCLPSAASAGTGHSPNAFRP
jgi:hypothetical protein